MKVFTLLKADHKKVAGILEKLDGTTERELEGHTQIKDIIFFPSWSGQLKRTT
jgi:hypothetical protein